MPHMCRRTEIACLVRCLQETAAHKDMHAMAVFPQNGEQARKYLLMPIRPLWQCWLAILQKKGVGDDFKRIENRSLVTHLPLRLTLRAFLDRWECVRAGLKR
jgi:hypothetical protein